LQNEKKGAKTHSSDPSAKKGSGSRPKTATIWVFEKMMVKNNHIWAYPKEHTKHQKNTHRLLGWGGTETPLFNHIAQCPVTSRLCSVQQSLQRIFTPPLQFSNGNAHSQKKKKVAKRKHSQQSAENKRPAFRIGSAKYAAKKCGEVPTTQT
jgi:hypothetical protein